jgi:threonyl-tRNA synthetase
LNLSTLRRTAAEITAAALFELYPNIELWGGEETPTGFFYDFYFPHSVHPETLSLIEEKIRQIVREKREIRTLEMVPFSARELLRAKGNGRFEELDVAEKGLIELIQIGAFHDLCLGPHLKNTAEAAAIKLLEIELLDGKGIRITGSAHISKQALKEFLKKVKDYEENCSSKVGERMGLWKVLANEEKVTLAKGIEMKRRVLDFLKKQLFQGATEVSFEGRGERISKHLEIAKPDTCLAESWIFEMDGQEELKIQISSFRKKRDSLREDLNSCLQSIGKTLIILGFHCEHRLTCKRRGQKGVSELIDALKGIQTEVQPLVLGGDEEPELHFVIEDRLGQKESLFQLRWVEREGLIPGICLTTSVERIVALLLESNPGALPTWLASDKGNE